jgi:hypothetical protein
MIRRAGHFAGRVRPPLSWIALPRCDASERLPDAVEPTGTAAERPCVS